LRQQARDLPAGTKEQQADAGGGQAGDLGNLAVRVTFRVGEPKQLTIARSQSGEGGTECVPRIALGRVSGNGGPM
jgi:hypothetical protein